MSAVNRNTTCEQLNKPSAVMGPCMLTLPRTRTHRFKSLENERFRKGSASLWVQHSEHFFLGKRLSLSLSRCGDGYGWRRNSGCKTGMVLNE